MADAKLNKRDAAKVVANEKRLAVLRETVFGDLADEAILELLAERRALVQENQMLVEQASAKQAEAEAKANAIKQAIAELNASITPDKSDDELLGIVKKRKELEAELSEAEEEEVFEEEKEEAKGESERSETEKEPEDSKKSEGSIEKEKKKSEEVSKESEEKIGKSPEEKETQEKKLEEAVREEKQSEENVVESSKIEPKKGDDRFGEAKIDATLSSQDATRFLELLKESPNEALEKLETLPLELRKSKVFMLEVAKADPAYAMHYADPKTLKKDEDFNIRIASMENPRNSGNPLAEMLSDARTPKVVMAAIKQDYRNVRYATPSMEGYEDMVSIAKKQAFEKVKSLGQAADLRLLLPKVLRDDLEFMKEVNGIMEGFKEAGKKKSGE